MAHFANVRHYVFRSNGHVRVVGLPTAVVDHRAGFVRLTLLSLLRLLRQKVDMLMRRCCDQWSHMVM